MKRLNDTWLRLLGPVGLFLFASFFFRLAQNASLSFSALLTNIIVSVGSGLICWQLARTIILWNQKRYPGLANTRRRIFQIILLMPVLVGFAWYLRHVVRWLLDGSTPNLGDFVTLSRDVGIQIFYHFIYFSIYEGWYILQQWQGETVETSTLEKASLQSQLTSLQHQVNPHFLFNSLNSLSYLIGDEPTQANAFLNQLTAVFRYILQASDHRLVPLQAELTFIRSYLHLLKTRYQAGLLVDITVSTEAEQLFIPPLTLQLLVENAIRYNKILTASPLHIRIYTTADQRLHVVNTLQRKQIRSDIADQGLSNLTVQYELFHAGKLLIEEKAGWFTVSMPLLSENATLPASPSSDGWAHISATNTIE